MRKIVLFIGMSLDGYIEGPDRDISWHRVDEELHEHMNVSLSAMGAFLDGRITYELMADYWPTADQAPDASPTVAEFARIWRDMPKIVYSRTLESAGWGTEIRREVDPAEVRELQAQPGGDIVIGGPNLAETFFRLGLIDEYRIYVHPVLVGGGTPLFWSFDGPASLRLLETKTFGNGVTMLRYSARPDDQVS